MKTYPAIIPPYNSPLLQREISRGERKIFQEFLNLNRYDDWFVCHSLMLPGDKYKSMYEMDFVLVGPPGLYVIEVKDNAEYEVQSGVWDYGYKRTSTSPFKQASDARFSLLKRLKNNFKFDFDIENGITHGIGVIFTENNFNLRSSEWDLSYVLDAHSINSNPEYLANFIKKMSKYWLKKREKFSLNVEQIEQLRYALRPEVELAKMLRYSVEIVDENLTALTISQYRALDLIPYNKRIIFEGSAGTGKTFLAIEAARRLSMQNQKVLFLCFNPLLAAYLTHNVSFPNLNITSVHEFLYDHLSDKKDFTRIPNKEIFSGNKYVKELPTEFLDQVNVADEDKYDVLLLDEAQDLLSSEYLMALGAVLKNSWEEGNWYVFLDSRNQTHISGYFDGEALNELKRYRLVYYPLTENCRNTVEIITQTKLLTGLGFSAHPLHNLSGESKIFWYDSPSMEYEEIKSFIIHLKNNFNAGDITLLTSKQFGSKSLHQKLMNDFIIEKLSRDSAVKFPFNKITVCDPINFKGLENRIVCIIDIDNKKDLDQYLLYVSFTRARYGLYIFINKSLKEELDAIQIKNLILIKETK